MDSLFPFQITVSDGSWRNMALGLAIQTAVNCIQLAAYTFAVFIVIKAVM